MVYRSIALVLLCVTVCNGQAVANAALGEYNPSFGFLRDTLFVQDSIFLEIQLHKQIVLVHHRTGVIERFPCSTGNPSLPEGIATRPGIFCVQNKARKAFSEAFQVNLNYWMGFDGGIGFHGLDGRSYYRFLGRRASSHGCVRISNETGSILFRKVRVGTVVFVHDASPARIVRFSDPQKSEYTPLDDVDPESLRRRLDAVSALRWDDTVLSRPLIVPSRRRFSKIAVGSVNAAMMVQFPIAVLGTRLVDPKRPHSAHVSVRQSSWLSEHVTIPGQMRADLTHVD